jgi:hypothetical protein
MKNSDTVYTAYQGTSNNAAQVYGPHILSEARQRFPGGRFFLSVTDAHRCCEEHDMVLHVHNLANDEVHIFDHNTAPIYGVCQCYAWSSGLSDEFNKQTLAGTLEVYYKTLPVVVGARTVSCGDWVALS